jgi:hypothetical protein
MNGIVPLMPTIGRRTSRERATPKSVSFTSPSNDTSTFAGFTSMWTMPSGRFALSVRRWA